MKIYWTKRALSRFLEIHTYILQEFGSKASITFKDKVFDFLELLEKFPHLGTSEVPEKNIYGFKSPDRQEYSIDYKMI